MSFPTGWGQYHKITVQGSKVPDSLVDFPILLSNGNFLATVYSNTQSAGQDLRFSLDTGGASQLPFEIVSWSTASQLSEVYVNTKSLASGTDKELYVWYDNATAEALAVGDDYGRNNVWTRFESVYHFETDGTDSAGAWDLTAYGTLTHNAGVLGNCVELGGVSSCYRNTASGAGNCAAGSPLYMETWLNPDILNAYQCMIGKYRDSPAAFVYQIDIENNGKLASNTRNDAWKASNNAFTQDAWQHTSLSYDGSATVSFTKNGVFNGGQAENSITNSNGGAIGFEVGGIAYTGPPQQMYNGQLDELRFGFEALGDNWGTTTFNSTATPSLFSIASDPISTGGEEPVVTPQPRGCLTCFTKLWGI